MHSLSAECKTALDNEIAGAIKTGQVPGLVVGISGQDAEIYFKAAGNNVVGDPSRGKITDDSVFWICSQTKMIVSIAALQLIDEGKITLDTAVADYLPVFSNPIVLGNSQNCESVHDPAKTVITIKHLLNHSSGLFYPQPEDRFGMEEPYVSKEVHRSQNPIESFLKLIVGDLPGLPLKFEPGTDFAYGWSSDALGFVVEKVSGLTLEDFCQQRIFKPLGMTLTSFYLTQNLRDKLVDLACRDEDGKLEPWANQCKIPENDPTKVRIHFGGDGLYSSMRDYLKLLRHLLQLHAGQDIPNPLLRPETVKMVFTPALNEKGAKSLSEYVQTPNTQYTSAAGISQADRTNRRKKGSIWWGGWANTFHFLDPMTGVAFVFGTQVCPPGDQEVIKLALRLEEVLYASLKN